MTSIWSLGAMSGTSLDGVDAALLKTDGETIASFGPTRYRPYADDERRRLSTALDAAKRWSESGAPRSALNADPDIAAAVDVTTDAHGQVFAALLADATRRPELVGFHGQTIWHDPSRRVTVQIGDAQRLTDTLGLDVVTDFRSADVAAGGEGAPFAPFYHFALARGAGLSEPTAFLNLGGVGNVTWVDPTAPAPEAPGALLAFDTGPANALVDDWMASRTGAAVDRDGATAAAGVVDEALVAQMSTHPYFAEPAPKSLDRNDFVDIARVVAGCSTEDGAATLTAFTAASVAHSVALLPSPPTRWLVCGGGRKNPTLMRMLGDRLGASVEPIEAVTIDGVAIDGDMVEAQAFAHLAVRAKRGLPLSAPGTTGAPSPMSGGRLFAAAA